jgi:hypothetical protein
MLMLQVVVLSDGVCAAVVGSTDTAVVLAVEADNGAFILYSIACVQLTTLHACTHSLVQAGKSVLHTGALYCVW